MVKNKDHDGKNPNILVVLCLYYSVNHKKLVFEFYDTVI